MPNSGFAKFTSRTLIAIAVVIAGLGGYSYYQYAVFCERVAALKAAGEPVSLQDCTHRVENAEDDAFTYLARITEQATNEFLGTVTEEQEAGSMELTDESVTAFLGVEAKYPTFFSELKSASEAPDISVRFDEGGNLEVGILQLQRIGRIMALKSRLLLREGNTQEAMEVSTQLFELADQVEKLPTLLNFLVACAYRVMAATSVEEILQGHEEIDPASVERLQATLARIDMSNGLINAIRFERILTLDTVRGPKGSSEGFAPGGLGKSAYVIPGSFAAFYGNTTLDQIEVSLEHCRAPLTTQFKNEQPPHRWSPFLSSDLTIFFDRIRNSVGQKQCVIQSLQILLALKTSEIPAEQAVLTQEDLIRWGVPEAITVDPFTGETMKVKRTDDRWQIYSLGPDQIEGENPATKTNDDAGLGKIR